jgi:hypothetical protein
MASLLLAGFAVRVARMGQSLSPLASRSFCTNILFCLLFFPFQLSSELLYLIGTYQVHFLKSAKGRFHRLCFQHIVLHPFRLSQRINSRCLLLLVAGRRCLRRRCVVVVVGCNVLEIFLALAKEVVGVTLGMSCMVAIVLHVPGMDGWVGGGVMPPLF